MTGDGETRGQNLLGRWVLANVVGFGVGMAIFAAVAEGIARNGVFGSAEIGDRVGHLIGLPLAGALFGYLQWLVLRRYVSGAGWAVLGAAVGLTAGYILGYIMGGPPFDFVLGPTLAGLFAGIAQWIALRRTYRAGWWAPLSAGAFALGGIVGTAIALLGLGDALGGSYPAWIALNGVVFAVTGAVGGVITGAVLVRIVKPAPAMATATPRTSAAR